MASDSGDDGAALRERVAQLEQTVAEQQQPSESPGQPTASRRGLLKGAAAVAGLGALGIYSSYPARAQAAGQVGTQSEPVDVEAYDLNVQGSVSGIDTGGVENPLTADLDADGNDLTDVGAAEVGEQNGSEINLTKLVNEGTYANIAEAIADEPPTNPEGTVHVIEPGVYGPISPQYSITWSNRVIEAKGSASVWDAGSSDPLPVTILVDDAATSALFALGDGNSLTQGVSFEGIQFRPQTSANSEGAFVLDGAVGNQTHSCTWRDCRFQRFAGPGFDSIGGSSTFNHRFVDCTFEANGAESYLGPQAKLQRCYIGASNTSGAAVAAGQVSSLVNCTVTSFQSGASGVSVSWGSQVHGGNWETANDTQGSGAAGLVIDGKSESQCTVSVRITGWDYSVRVDEGTLMGALPINSGALSDVVRFESGIIAHNRSILMLPANATVSYNDARQDCLILKPGVENNPDANTLRLADDADGSGNPGLVYGGGNAIDNSLTHYLTFDGSR